MYIIDFWNSLSLATQIFYCIAIPSTLVLLIQTVAMFIGIGDDADGGIDDAVAGNDIDVEADVPDGVFGEDNVDDIVDAAGLEGLRIFTVRGIIAFFVVFGWVGAVMDSAGIAIALTLFVATACGFLMMLLIAFMLKWVLKLRSDGTADNRNAIGTAGKVHLTVPALRSGEGKVHIMLQGAYVERNAVTDSDEPLVTGSEIVVVGVSGQTDLIVKKK